jgi:hypothetical protein
MLYLPTRLLAIFPCVFCFSRKGEYKNTTNIYKKDLPKAFPQKEKDKKSTLFWRYPLSGGFRFVVFPGEWSSKTPRAHVLKKKTCRKHFQNK